MTKWLKTLPLLLALALAGPAMGQEEDTGDAAPNETDTLPLGQPVGPQPGQPYEKEVFTDWRIICARGPEDQETCNMQQLARDPQGNPVAQMSLVPLPAEAAPRAAAVEVVAPLETLLSGDLRIQVDDGEDRLYRFTFCNPEACFARFAFTQTEVDAFKAGGEATIKIVPLVAPDQLAEVTVSLRGFTAAYDSLVPEE